MVLKGLTSDEKKARHKQQQKEWYQKNREHCREKQKRFHEEHPDYRSNYRADNRERIQAYWHQHYLKQIKKNVETSMIDTELIQAC